MLNKEDGDAAITGVTFQGIKSIKVPSNLDSETNSRDAEYHRVEWEHYLKR